MAHWSRAMPQKNNAERWREMAERTRARADGMRDRASRRTMLGIAMAYETLARRADLLAAGERSAETMRSRMVFARMIRRAESGTEA